MITFIRPGWYKLFPQLVISFSFITLDFGRSRDHHSKELGPVSEYPHYVTAAILVFQTNPPLLYFRCIFLLKMLCLLDVLCLLEMLCLLDMLCLLEVFCLLEMLYLLEMLCLLENALLACSGADICRICVELCAFGLKASYLVKMLPFLH